MPHTPKPHKSFSSGLSQSLVAFWMLCLGSAPALQRRAAGSALCPPAGTQGGQGAACPGLPTSHWDRPEGRVGRPSSPSRTHIQPPRRTGSLWLGGFGPSPTLGVAAKAKQSSPKEARFGSLRKCYLWRAGWCEGEAGESCQSGSQTLG